MQNFVERLRTCVRQERCHLSDIIFRIWVVNVSNGPMGPRWREVAVPVLWPVPEAAVTVFNTPDDGCCDTRNMLSSFAVNKYLHTVASGWIFIHINYAKFALFFHPSVIWLCFGWDLTYMLVYRGADKSLARPGRKQANVSVSMAWISFGALLCRKKKWWQLRSRCCWNRARPWHASQHVSFLVGLRTYQHPGYLYRLPRQVDSHGKEFYFFFVFFLSDILLKIILLYGNLDGPHVTGAITPLFCVVRRSVWYFDYCWAHCRGLDDMWVLTYIHMGRLERRLSGENRRIEGSSFRIPLCYQKRHAYWTARKSICPRCEAGC